LWFDETYDEERYFLDSSIAAAESAAVLLVIGTSGATNLPSMVVNIAARRGATLVVIGADPSPFSAVAVRTGGVFIQGTAVESVPRITGLWMGS
jgi:NAD-dependent deacetylase